MNSFLPSDVQGPQTRSSSNASCVYVIPDRSQSEYIQGSVSDESASEESGLNDEDDEDGRSPPKKRARRAPPVKGDPRQIPCIRCVNKMVDQGPRLPCCSQACLSTLCLYMKERVLLMSIASATGCYLLRLCSYETTNGLTLQVPDFATVSGQRLQEAALRVGKGETVNNWDELVAQFKQAIERGAAPQAGPGPVNLVQTNARAEPRRENPRRSAVASGATPRRECPPQEITGINSRLGNASAQTAPEIPQPANRDSQAQLSKDLQAHNQRLEQLLERENPHTQMLQEVLQHIKLQGRLFEQMLQVLESGFANMCGNITQLNENSNRATDVLRRIGQSSNQQTIELRQMHDEMRRVNGSDNADLPSFAP
ncbi:hypothetical protein FSPOR_2915 [Fusarium sporotrichioides]|uniref:Uncharacterized protein n=1 Tax=Fusarium sporotrichioides TaxID=5514 RepID=A0A395SI31_FUSSP|nr:hypothetical protein FSPOR_2915 [Fusarium sporotrichioides]